MSKEDIIKCFLDCKDKGNGFQLTLTNKDIDIIANEIERLKEENNFLKLNNPQMNLEHFRVVKENKRKIDNLRQVNKRLNNIINKLEKTLLEWHEYWEDDDSYSWQYKNAYDYLQELKGSGK